jgi:hypothetical protein
VVLRGIRIAEAGVRFSLSPHKSKQIQELGGIRIAEAPEIVGDSAQVHIKIT